MNDYSFKTEPYQHQFDAFRLCRDKETFALFMEMGTGKTKVAIDKACFQYCEGIINAVLIVAPNGVHSNWVTHELHKHVPDYIRYNALIWKSKKFKDKFERYLFETDRLFIFTINIEAIATEEGKKTIKRFLEGRSALMIIDESSRIKTPSALRTKAAINFGKLAKERLIMSGTPITQSPFDLYAQFKFLDPTILDNQTYTAFKHEYGIFIKKHNFKTGWNYDELESYRNLDKLQARIQAHSYRITKDECLDLPEKVYKRYSVELTTKQRYYYDTLKNEFYLKVGEREVTTPIMLTNLLRLQQITGGFVTFLEEDQATAINDGNPKLDLLLEILEDTHSKVIIWSRFKAEIKLIASELRNKFGKESVVEYWGEISQDDRQKAVDDFQNKIETRFLVGNARAGGIGLTLTAANMMIYFSNDFSLETRLQSEDRAHRIGQRYHVTYIDIEATDTLDSKIIDALRNKKNIADLITGDKIKEWI